MRYTVHDLFDALERGRRFVTHDIWHIGQPGEPVPQGFIIRHIRVVILLFQGLVKDDLLLRASALTFATTLAIVPFLALMFFMVKTFSLGSTISELIPIVAQGSESEVKDETVLNEFIRILFRGMDGSLSADAGADHDLHSANTPVNALPLQEGMPVSSGGTGVEPGAPGAVVQPQGTGSLPQPDRSNGNGNHSPPIDLDNPVAAIRQFAEQGAGTRTVTSAGVIFVLTTLFGLMMNIESSFNTIWGIQRRRSWYRMISNYLVVLLALPFLVGGEVGLMTILETKHIAERLGGVAIAMRGVQYVVIWLAFTTLYFAMPNTRVKLRYALLAGVVAGTLWCLLSWMYVKFQFGLARYTLLYTVGAQIPVFLMWAYFSWLIVLLGAELSFAYQNEKTYAMERFAEGASYAYREALGLWAMIELGRRFDRGEPGLSAESAAKAWNVPARLVNETFRELEEGRLVVQCASRPPTYQPSRSIDKITAADVVRCLRESGRDPSELRKAPACRTLVARLYPWIDTPHADVTVADLIRELAATPAPGAEKPAAAPANVLPMDIASE